MSTKTVVAAPWPDETVEAEPITLASVKETTEDTAEKDEFKVRQKRLEARKAEIMAALREPLESGLVKKRLVNPYKPKSRENPELEYLEWPTVVRNLNRIFGFGMWDMDVVSWKEMGQKPSGVPFAIVATVKLTVHFAERYDEVAEYTNVGTGTVRGDNWGNLDMAVKGAVWDGVKRCATALGEQFGLSLYDKDTPEAVDDEEEQPARVSQFKPRQTPPSHDKSGVGDSFECEDCGKEVRGYTSKAGKTYTAQDLYEMSVKFAGAGYCYDCKAKHQAK